MHLTPREFVEKLNLKPGQKVLDIGCGTGGSAFFMARNYGVDVYGYDLSTNMIGIAQDYRNEMEAAVKHRVQFYVEDAMIMEYPDNFYDVVYSRDTILHINDKPALFRKLLKTLKPGGKLMISDYCRGDTSQHTKAFQEYVKQRDYDLHTVTKYGEMLQKCGFKKVRKILSTLDTDVYMITSQVNPMNKAGLMLDIMGMELNKFSNVKSKFIEEFGIHDYNYIEQVIRNLKLKQISTRLFQGLEGQGREGKAGGSVMGPLYC